MLTTNDGWPATTYRQHNTNGKVGWSSRLGRSIGMTRRQVTRIEAVIDQHGHLMPESEYGLEPFKACQQHNDGPPRLWFRVPRQTRGLTILFEAA